MTTEQAFRRYRDVLESLSRDSLALLDDVVAPNVRFDDPFHSVAGAARMKSVFARLFEVAGDIAFVIDDWAAASNTVYFHWTLSARLRGNPWTVTGVTRATYDDAGRRTAVAPSGVRS